ncbi:MAG: class I SAM-dependent methyltransferase [Betaproteobacteria bacterium]|nr:class I SAM-dependent methyltransferase [Betaproteobacteria bacterium]
MMQVLKNKSQIKASRQKLLQMGGGRLEGVLTKVLRRLGVHKKLSVGDMAKSWDVALTLEFIEAQFPKDARILDLGAYCSEVPVLLANMGFTGVHGVDLNPNVKAMPHADRVQYSVSDFMSTPFPQAIFDAVTAISVIEHGYEPERLFTELGRLLRPGGYFIASFDYWPDKINTGNTRFFDMTWLIFSEQDVGAMLEVAKRHGLSPAGDLHPQSAERAIHCMGYDYTFGWLVLRKDA